MNKKDIIEMLRMNIDNAIDQWLLANGIDYDNIGEMDYSYLNQELDDILEGLKATK